MQVKGFPTLWSVSRQQGTFRYLDAFRLAVRQARDASPTDFPQLASWFRIPVTLKTRLASRQGTDLLANGTNCFSEELAGRQASC
jgi:hypothetical protein